MRAVVDRRAAATLLNAEGCVLISDLFPSRLRRAIADEAVLLADSAAVRRHLSIPETGFTPRRMSNVTRARIAELASVIPSVYRSGVIADAVSEVACMPVFPCPYEPEQFVITRLERSGDTHGWHWDDYGFALVWVAECPDPALGGFVEYVPDTHWDKHEPGVDRILTERKVHQLDLQVGDVYLMRTDTTLHRVHPLRGGRRTIVNMAFATRNQLSSRVSHETMDALWSPSASERTELM